MPEQRKLNLFWSIPPAVVAGMAIGYVFIITERARLGLWVDDVIPPWLEIALLLLLYTASFLAPTIIVLRNFLRRKSQTTTYWRSLSFFIIGGYVHIVAFVGFLSFWKGLIPNLEEVLTLHLVLFGPNLMVSFIGAFVFRKKRTARTDSNILDEELTNR